MKNITKRAVAFVMSLVTLAGTMSESIAAMAQTDFSDEIVAAFTEAYGGDEARALGALESLYQAGIIDSEGNMVELDIREDGEAVSLGEITMRIADNESVGDITVNGHASTAAQLMKKAQLQSTLEIIRLMDEDVEVTDEHIANLESLLQGISDGSVDIDSALGSGAVSVTQHLAGSGTAGDFPETKTGEGTVSANTNGEYTAPYISGSEYEASHTFTLADPMNNTYFTDSNYQGIAADGAIALSCNKETANVGDTVTVTATLNKAQAVPVSFDWSAGGAGLAETQSGSVLWKAGETGVKTFEITVTRADENYWIGNRAFVINVSNAKGALLNDSEPFWSKTVKVTANDPEVEYWEDITDWNGYNSRNGLKDKGCISSQEIYGHTNMKPKYDGNPIRVTLSWYSEIRGGTTLKYIVKNKGTDRTLGNTTFYSGSSRAGNGSFQYKNHKVIRNDEEDTIVVKNTNKPIVSQEIWDRLREMEQSVSQGKRNSDGGIRGGMKKASSQMRTCFNDAADRT